MKRIIDWRIFSVSLSVAALLALGLHAVSGLNLWICFGLVVVAMLVNGIIATIEDEMPGGFHNPEPETPQTQARVARATERYLRAVASLKRRIRH